MDSSSPEKTDHLKKMGLKTLETDSCDCVKHNDNDKLIVTIYVDDLIIATNNEKN